MQLKGMHKGIYTLYSYASKHLYVKARREKHQKTVKQWDRLKSTGMDSKYLPEYSGCSRATYYRAKKRLKEIESGKFPASKRPKHLNKPKWGESEKQLVLRIRRENPTYGKAKITTILKRDHEFAMNESTVGRIFTHLKEKKLITKSISVVKSQLRKNRVPAYIVSAKIDKTKSLHLPFFLFNQILLNLLLIDNMRRTSTITNHMRIFLME